MTTTNRNHKDAFFRIVFGDYPENALALYNAINGTNYENYVHDVIERSGYNMGGTYYAPVLKAIIEGNVRRTGGFLGFRQNVQYDPSLVDNNLPTFILFITDGENSDHDKTDDIIRRSSSMNVFIQFIGIGNEKFRYLMKLDDLPGRTRDNTGFSKMKDLMKASDAELYNNVLEQFSRWLRHLQ